MKYLLFLIPFLFVGCAAPTSSVSKDVPVYVYIPVACKEPIPEKPEIGENNTITFINVVEYTKKLESVLNICKQDENKTTDNK